MTDGPSNKMGTGPVLHTFPYRDKRNLFRPDQKRFVVALFTGRTGTTFVQHSLNQHPDMRFEGEFLAEFTKEPDPIPAQRERIRRFFAGEGDAKVHAFKTKMQDVRSIGALRRHIMNGNCIVIHSFRNNIIKQAISGERSIRLVEEAKKNAGVNLPYNLTVRSVAQGVRPLGKAVLNKRKLDGAIAYFTKGEEALRKFLESLDGIHVIEIAYEELNADKQLVLDALTAYMGLDPFPWEETILKHTSDNLRDVIENFDEISEMYRGTPYYRMFFEEAGASRVAIREEVS
jgi:hypothetical protein